MIKSDVEQHHALSIEASIPLIRLTQLHKHRDFAEIWAILLKIARKRGWAGMGLKLQPSIHSEPSKVQGGTLSRNQLLCLYVPIDSNCAPHFDEELVDPPCFCCTWMQCWAVPNFHQKSYYSRKIAPPGKDFSNLVLGKCKFALA